MSEPDQLTREDIRSRLSCILPSRRRASFASRSSVSSPACSWKTRPSFGLVSPRLRSGGSTPPMVAGSGSQGSRRKGPRVGRRTALLDVDAEQEAQALSWLPSVEIRLMPATDDPGHPISRHMLAVRADVHRMRLEGLSAAAVADKVRVLLAAQGLERIAHEADREP